MRNNKGITLIALVITIIVLLILAGVSIAMLTGNNGILTQADNAQTASLKAEAEEAVKMAINEIMTDKQAVESGLTSDGRPTEATADNIASVVEKNNAGSVCGVKTAGNEGAARAVTYQANANSQAVDVTISATDTISVGEPYDKT